MLLQDVNELLVTPANERHAITEKREALARLLERRRIAVDRDEARMRIHLQKRFRMPAQPDRRIDEESVFAGRPEVLNDFV